MKLYLAGPMRGIKAYNHPAFDIATTALRAAGHEVFSPAENDRTRYPARDWYKATGNLADDGIESADIRAIIKMDLDWICDNAKGIALLPNWERSKGVKVENALAEFLSIPVKPWREFL